MRFLHVLQIGTEILADVEAVIAGLKSTFQFTWGGFTFTVTAKKEGS